MYILSLSFGLTIHNSVNSVSLQNFKGVRWQTNFRLPKYDVINIFKLEYHVHRYLLSDFQDQTCFGKSRMTMSFFLLELLFYVHKCNIQLPRMFVYLWRTRHSEKFVCKLLIGICEWHPMIYDNQYSVYVLNAECFDGIM